jgi:hypothetical protein
MADENSERIEQDNFIKLRIDSFEYAAPAILDVESLTRDEGITRCGVCITGGDAALPVRREDSVVTPKTEAPTATPSGGIKRTSR